MKKTFRFALIHNGELNKFSDSDRMTLLNKVKSFMRANQITFAESDLLAQIDRQSKFQSQPAKAAQRKSLADVLNGAKALMKYTTGNCASQKEITRRASICANCPLKVATSGCMACGAAKKAKDVVDQIKRLKKTLFEIPSELNSKYCEICGCSIPLMLVTKFEDFKPESREKNDRRPDHCWLKRTSPNFTQE